MPRALAVLPFAVAGLCGVLCTAALGHRALASRALGPPPRAALTANAGAGLVSPALPAAASRPESASPGATFPELPAVRFSNQNTQRSESIQLYDAAGRVNETAAARLDALLCDTRDPKAWATTTLDRRTLQLAVRSALHFHVTEIQVVSAYRKAGRRREGPHANGKAIDFKLPGVAPRALAAYLRTLPRVGVGIYTHPKTSFVHLDDREHSFHWLDASPPGRTWRERSIGDTSLARRDAAYRRSDDWPEGTSPPGDALE